MFLFLRFVGWTLLWRENDINYQKVRIIKASFLKMSKKWWSNWLIEFFLTLWKKKSVIMCEEEQWSHE
jgi:hypothetical protein